MMLHRDRHWVVCSVATAEELAAKLTQMTWCSCNAFRVADSDYLFLNDATSADGAQEYGIVKGAPERPPWLQVESITFSWCSYQKALRYIRLILAGRYDRTEYVQPVTLQLEKPA